MSNKKVKISKRTILIIFLFLLLIPVIWVIIHFAKSDSDNSGNDNNDNDGNKRDSRGKNLPTPHSPPPTPIPTGQIGNCPNPSGTIWTSNTQEAQDYLSLHNKYRQIAGSEPLSWSDDLAKCAQAWSEYIAKDGCDFHHPLLGSQNQQTYLLNQGQNLYAQWPQPPSPETTVDAWYDECHYYDPNNPTASQITRSGKPTEVDHFTQVVWKDTKQVGCGMAKCGDHYVVNCNYYPGGNILNAGYFERNVGDPSSYCKRYN
jgi:hypothetical protein